jgi:GH15 family glucan-1,4-alpha-glucosidase
VRITDFPGGENGCIVAASGLAFRYGCATVVKYYGFLSNSYTAALVSADGSVDWLPFPRFDSPAVFAKLLGAERNGYFAIRPDRPYTAEQHYIDDTNVLKTVFTTDEGGTATVIDYLAIGSQELRRVVTTNIPLDMVVRPVFQSGLIAAGIAITYPGALYTNPLSGEAVQLVVNGTHPARYLADRELWQLAPGRYDIRLIYHPELSASDLDWDVHADGVRALRRNIRYWQRLARMPYNGPFAREFRRSLLVLHGLTYRTNGAVIAAPTTSLPEVVGGTRQWDYRFAWVRDGCYAAEALLAAGEVVAPRRMLEFFLTSVDLQGKPFKAPFFRVDGTLIRGERELSWLKGFRGSRPVREGNAATAQQQLDIEGALIWALWRYYADTQDAQFVRSYAGTLESILDWVARHWDTPDASLWEFRGQDAHYTHSKLMCWVALHYGGRLLRAVGRRQSAERYRTLADQVRAKILADGYDADRNSYTQAFGSHVVDAALLTMPLYDFLPVDDPRFLGTLAAIEQDLVEGPWVYRYRTDMLGEAAHPFLLGSYWLARIYVRLGRLDDAETLLTEVFSHATDLGLLGEHLDVTTMEPRGNFPQGFSHLGAVLAILELAEQRGYHMARHPHHHAEPGKVPARRPPSPPPGERGSPA